MNLLDFLIVLTAVLAAVGGYRLGFVARAFSWVGLLLGLLVTARLLPTLVDWFSGSDPSARLLAAIGVLLAGAFVGQAMGLLVGSHIHLALPGHVTRQLDRAGGGAAGVAGVLVVVWLMVPAMADVPGNIARMARGSTIARAIDDVAPRPPDTLQALRRLVGDAGFPRVFTGLRPSPDLGPPPESTGLTAELADQIAASTVKVEGQACRRIQEGSGFMAAPGLLVTNAHVVAGEDDTTVIRPDGRAVRARVVLFDPDRDLAVLSVAEDFAAPLPIGDGAVGVTGGVFGYPGGGSLRIAPFEIRERVQAVGRDLYDSHDTRRDVYVLASDLQPGDSGGAVVEPGGEVVGVAFAIAPDRPGTAYALTTDELRAVLAAVTPEPADTGPCLAR